MGYHERAHCPSAVRLWKACNGAVVSAACAVAVHAVCHDAGGRGGVYSGFNWNGFGSRRTGSASTITRFVFDNRAFGLAFRNNI